MEPVYLARRAAQSRFFEVRGLRLHAHVWGDASLVTPERPALLLMHGWMDVGASYQFVVDALAADRYVIAADWRGFGRSEAPQPTDGYSFADYLGDLDGLVDAISPEAPIDLVGHSMGGNIVMLYAGVRPQRVRRLVNLEGFGLPQMAPEMAPKRYAQWLDELKTPQALRDYASADEVAQRLRKNNPRLSADKATWLAPHWARLDVASGRWQIQGDPAHKRTNPVLYRVEEILACWRRIECPLLWIEGEATDIGKWWGERYTKSEFDARLAVVPQVERHALADCGHMLHHDQPQRVAALVEAFLDR
ncbi:alpha/beta fold hydrolase [Rivibacter subsaxonicus]|uniref:Alpha-beta hydrolase superfamily lysophospholipase n=1 Tax=Rivibacter subsaxonicus TaxID=457575 RepID=A0A4V2FUL5_9BURK|nr:alpha/beta hydrolase [Rivibacter subsaxonicus]RZU02506.1 alpha-beta hydrolase superfamily lysophospholipase [Rivibacter subsaxonicus]